MAKQEPLPGAEVHEFPDVQEAMVQYRDDRDERMAWTKKEVASKTKLHAAMNARGITEYRALGLLAQIDVTQDLHVNKDGKGKDPAAAQEQDGDGA